LDVSGSHKWIGLDLFARLVLEPNLETVAVTLPSGRWYDFESGAKVSERGGETLQVSSRQGELRRTPLFARGGAMIPVGSPDSSQTDQHRLELCVFPGAQAWEGELVEDDGWSQEYRTGKLARTGLRQSAWSGRFGTITIDARSGGLAASLGQHRDIVVHVAAGHKEMRALVDEQDLEMTRRDGFWTLELPARSVDRPTVISFR
jgi:hypothetical protein